MFRLFKKKKSATSDAVTSDKDQAVQESDRSEAGSAPAEETAPESSQLEADTSRGDAFQQEQLEPVTGLEVPDREPSIAEKLRQTNKPTPATEKSPLNNETPSQQPAEAVTQTDALDVVSEQPKKTGLFGRLRQGLAKTGGAITEGMGTLVLGKKKIDEDVLEELETRLLMADVGMDATMRIIDHLTNRTRRNELKDIDALTQALHDEMTEILKPVAKPLSIDPAKKPMVILMVGINGAGKTTTIGKLAKKFQHEGKSVMLAAGDTFRAAAVEQLQVWGERNNIPVIAQGTGADSASVIYDAMESARARQIDVLLADTAGRLHTQTNLMEELKKVKRVMQKIDPSAPHEIMLIVDAGIGQNALAQAKEFNNALDLTGITVTKLDGTAKGGILFAIAEQTGIAVRFIGVGESIDDLQEFDAGQFVRALLGHD